MVDLNVPLPRSTSYTSTFLTHITVLAFLGKYCTFIEDVSVSVGSVGGNI